MGLVASIRGEKSHEIIKKGLEVLINLTHRGAAGCDPETGDGAGILIQIPHVFFARECGELGIQLPALGAYGVAMCFLPVDKHSRLQCEGVFERIAQAEGLTVLGWRDTPVNGDAIGREARASQPYIEQLCGVALRMRSQPRRLKARTISMCLRSRAAPSSTKG
jgi:glutamate synthase domain-containing protein 1